MIRWAGGGLVRRFAEGAGNSLAAAVIGQSLPLISAAVLARILRPDAFGAFLFLYGTAATFASLTGYGFGLTATRYVAFLSSRQPLRAGAIIRQLLGASIRVSLLAAVTGVIGCAWMNVHTLGGTWSIASTALLFFAVAIAGVQSGILGGFHCFSGIARGNLVRMLMGLPLAVWGGWRLGAAGALAGLALAWLTGGVVNHLQIVRACRANGVPLDWGSPIAEREVWTAFSIPAFFAYALVMPVLWVGQTILLALPNGLHEVAVFNIASHWRNVIVFVPAAMVQVATPLMAEFSRPEDQGHAARVFYVNLAGSGLIALCCGGLVALFGGVILAAYGQTYSSSWPVLAVTAIGAVLAAVNNSLGSLIVAAGRMWTGLMMNLFWAAAVLVQAGPFSHRWGALGLSVAVLTAYVLHTAFQAVYISRARLLPAFAGKSLLANAL